MRTVGLEELPGILRRAIIAMQGLFTYLQVLLVAARNMGDLHPLAQRPAHLKVLQPLLATHRAVHKFVGALAHINNHHEATKRRFGRSDKAALMFQRSVEVAELLGNALRYFWRC